MRTPEQKEAIFLSFAQMTEDGASEQDIKREIRLSDSQYHTCVNHWYSVFHGKKAGKATFSAECLPLEAKAILGLTSGDRIVVDIPDESGSCNCTIIRAAGSPDNSNLN